MKINFHTVSIGGHTGYGNAGRLLVKALEDRSVEMQADSPITLNFCMPTHYEYSAYTIGYTPWESTEVPPNWVAGLNLVKQLWTPAKWIANVFSEYREDFVPVIPHGIEPCWQPFKHERRDRPFTFIHVGEPAARKGGDIVLEAWHRAFKDRKDVRLIMKCIKYPTCRIKDDSGSIIASPSMYDNVSVIGSIFAQEEMWSLYMVSDCMVYPSRGEGFGLIPFEAMASGLPTIIPAQGMGDYTQWSGLQLKDSTWVKSTQQRIHPGKWMDHSVDELIFLMETAINQHEVISEDAFVAAENIHREYSWAKIAEMVHARLDVAELRR